MNKCFHSKSFFCIEETLQINPISFFYIFLYSSSDAAAAAVKAADLPEAGQDMAETQEHEGEDDVAETQEDPAGGYDNKRGPDYYYYGR